MAEPAEVPFRVWSWVDSFIGDIFHSIVKYQEYAEWTPQKWMIILWCWLDSSEQILDGEPDSSVVFWGFQPIGKH